MPAIMASIECDLNHSTSTAWGVQVGMSKIKSPLNLVCPTCGAGVNTQCLSSNGFPRFESHIARRIAVDCAKNIPENSAYEPNPRDSTVRLLRRRAGTTRPDGHGVTWRAIEVI